MPPPSYAPNAQGPKKLVPLWATSHTRLRAHDQYTSSSHWWKGGAGPSSLHTILEGPTKYVNARWMKKVYMDSYMALNGSCFMVNWTIFKNYLLEVGLTQNLKTMALRTVATVNLFYFIMCEDPHE